VRFADRERRSATTTISANHQITIPKPAFIAAGLRVGERCVVTAEEKGHVTVVRTGAA
jgi:bifunctional DNA-binding transcriptional regulator/antitoxin component of YhaV-PrlF toxin-antitoxin module